MSRPEAPTAEFEALQRAVAGRYSLVRELGRGGMGVVFLAADLALDRPVALKLLALERSSEPVERERFVREARIAARLSHPHIVPIHAVEEVGELAFYVMAWVDGDSLGALVRQSGPLPPAQVQRLLQEVAWALSHAHAHGVIHRDIKPDNILVERGSGRALVADFGIAIDQSRDTSDPRIVGTPRWMSPEQLAGATLDGRSDLYSSGLVAWYALAGEASRPGDAMDHCPGPEALARVIMRCVKQDAAQRFASADDLALVLRSVAERRPVVTPRVRQYLELARASGSELVTVGTAGAAALVMLVAATQQPAGDFFSAIGVGINAAIFAGVGAAMVGLAAVRVTPVLGRARALLRDGYDVEAVNSASALLADEESVAGAASEPAAPGIVLRAGLGGAVAAAGFWLSVSSEGSFGTLAGVAMAIGAPAAMARSIATLLARRGSAAPRRALAAFNRGVFRAARWLAGDPVSRPVPSSGDATVAAIGREATAMVAALPPAVRAGFEDVPALVERLEALARGEAGERVPDERRQVARAALDTLRLELMKLEAGVITAPDFTRELERVRRVGLDVQRVLDARREVEHLLRDDPVPSRDA